MSGVVLALLGALTVVAQDPNPATPSSPSSTVTATFASVYPGSATYEYLGCYNETTGNADVGNVRALAGGNMVRGLSLQCFTFTPTSAAHLFSCWCG